MSRIFSIAAFILALLIFFGYVSPTWSGSIAATQAAIASDNQALASSAEYSARQNELASARNAIDPADLTRLAVFLPSSVDNVQLILDLNALAARSGLTLNSINVANNASGSGTASAGALPAGGTSPIGSVDLSLSATGSYSALQTFLHGMESSARLLDVRDLAVRGSDTGVYTYQMSVRLYWLH